MPRALPLLSLLIAGCTLFDEHASVRLLPPGPLHTNGPLMLYVEADVTTSAEVLLDGRSLGGSFPVGAFFTVEIGVAEGSHRLVARVHDGTRPVESAPVEVIVDRTPPSLVSSSPQPGTHDPGQPLIVTATFDEPLDPSSSADAWCSYSGRQPVTVSLSPDGREIQVDAGDLRLDELGPAQVYLHVRDLAGNPATVGLGSWSAPQLSGSFLAPTSYWLRGVVLVSATWTPTPTANVLLDGVAVGQLAQGGTLSFDTRSVPDGRHVLSLDAPGYDPIPSASQLQVYVDNTPPVLLACTPRATALDDASVQAGIDAVFSEAVLGGGLYWAEDRIRVSLAGTPVPGTWAFDASGFADPAGNPVAVPARCEVFVPAWRKPWGTGPLQLGGDLRAEALGMGYLTPANGNPDRGVLFHVAPAGDVGAGTVRTLEGTAPAPWSVGTGMTSGAGAIASQLATSPNGFAAWIEVDAAGNETLRRGSIAGGSLAPVLLNPASGPVQLAPPADHGSLAWIQPDASGLGRLTASFWASDPSGSVWVLAQAGIDPAGDVREAAVDDDAYEAVAVAFVEVAAGGVPQAYVQLHRRWTGAQFDLLGGGSVNRDPLRPASQPAIADDVPGDLFVAWVEDGQVLLRQWSYSGSWSAPAVMNADPSAPARWPRLFARSGGYDRLVFLERGPAGDRFVAWRRAAWGPWQPLPPLDTGGDVTSYAWQAEPLAIAWTDAASAVHLRVFNE